MLAPEHLENPKDMVINELTAGLRQMILLADFVCWLIINQSKSGWSKQVVKNMLLNCTLQMLLQSEH